MTAEIQTIAGTAGLQRRPIGEATERDILALILVELRAMNRMLADDAGRSIDLHALRRDEAYDLTLTS